MKRSTGKFIRTPFVVFAVSKTCFMEATYSVVCFSFVYLDWLEPTRDHDSATCCAERCLRSKLAVERSETESHGSCPAGGAQNKNGVQKDSVLVLRIFCLYGIAAGVWHHAYGSDAHSYSKIGSSTDYYRNLYVWGLLIGLFWSDKASILLYEPKEKQTTKCGLLFRLFVSVLRNFI